MGIILTKPDQQSIRYMIIVAVAAVLIGAGVFLYLRTEVKEANLEKPETLIERQIRKIDELRGDAQPLSEEEIQKQIDEIDKLHQESK